MGSEPLKCGQYTLIIQLRNSILGNYEAEGLGIMALEHFQKLAWSTDFYGGWSTIGSGP
jgi:hypothetical protein